MFNLAILSAASIVGGQGSGGCGASVALGIGGGTKPDSELDGDNPVTGGSVRGTRDTVGNGPAEVESAKLSLAVTAGKTPAGGVGALFKSHVR